MRYALYFTPPKDDPLTRAAARWLGRDAFTGETTALPTLEGISSEKQRDLIADPRRYGFHATLKAPFSLASSVHESELIEAIEDFAVTLAPFDIPELVLGQLGHFFALVPGQPCQPLQDFAAATVRAFEPYRAALSDADIARRKPEGLSESHRANLIRWGYPYVMDEFRFHMTLTGPVEPALSEQVRGILEQAFAGHVHRPLTISGLALFVEETRGAPFAVHSWLPLGSP